MGSEINRCPNPKFGENELLRNSSKWGFFYSLIASNLPFFHYDYTGICIIIFPDSNTMQKWWRSHMKLDNYILLFLWIFFPILLWRMTPRSRLRETIATILFFQMLTWLVSIVLSNFGSFHSPDRMFKYASDINFTMEFLILPTFAVLFQLTFPISKGFIRRMFHYLFWVGIILFGMILLRAFTNIVEFEMDHLIISFFNFLIELWLCRRYILWMVKQQELKKDALYEN